MVIKQSKSSTVTSISDRNNITNKIDGMVVTVEDASSDVGVGTGLATYSWNAKLNKWVLISKDYEKTMQFTVSDLLDIDDEGKVQLGDVPTSGVIFNAMVFDPNNGIMINEINARTVAVDASGIVSGLSDFKGKKFQCQYGHGEIRQNLNDAVNTINDKLKVGTITNG